ncbi:MAG: ABC transporter substrate-binding protein [Acidimicrobiales bacterium]
MNIERHARRRHVTPPKVVAMLAGALALAFGSAPGRAQPGPTTEVVRFPFPQDDGSLTPYSFERGYPLMTLVYDTLLWRDADGVPRPWLATPEFDPGGRQVTLRLARGVRWHDGTPLTASDVEFTFRYVAEHYHPRFTPALRAVEQVTAADDHTVVITLRHPSPGFADQPLADLPILPAHVWASLAPEAIAPPGLPLGSGPYRLAEYRPGTAYRFEANPDYFRGPPAVTTLEVPVVTDAGDAIGALERGEVDMIPSSLPPVAATELRERLGPRVLDGPSYLGTELLFNVRRPPFDRSDVRRAVARALDLRRLAAAVGGAVAADQGYLHPSSSWSPGRRLQVFDDAGARREIGRLGRGPVEVLAAGNDPVRREAGRQVALALQRVGLQAVVKFVPHEELATAVGEDGSEPSFQAAIWSIPPLVSHDPDFLRRLFGSQPLDAPLNFAGYRSEAFDALADRIGSTPDPIDRKAVVGEALRLLATDVPAIPLFFPRGAYAYRPARYDGWVFVKGAGILDKLSFVEPGRQGAAAPPGSAGETSGGPGTSLRTWAVAVLALAGVVGVVIVRRGRD